MDRTRFVCLVAAVLSPVAALLIRFGLDPWLGSRGGFPVFIVPIALSAWCGGLCCGLVSLTVTMILSLWFLLPYSVPHHPEDLGYLCLFLVSSVVMIGFSEEMHRSKGRLEGQARLLRTANEEKDRMVATLAHELKNPISTLSNALHLMRLRAESHGDIEKPRLIAERSLVQMGRLVDDMLDVSRISRGRVQLRYCSFDLGELLTDLIPVFEEQAQQKGLALNVQVEPAQAFGDPVRLTQVFQNLVGNALKFTDSGGVTLRMSQDDGTARVVIQDSGLGIDPLVLPHIWEPFRQGLLQDHRGGLGLGLSVVKGFVELHGGTVTVRSGGLGTGSTFTVELPLEEGLVQREDRPLDTVVTNPQK